MGDDLNMLELGRRAVASKGWAWLPGMTAIPLSHERERWLLCWCEEDGSEAGGYQTTGGKWWGIANSDLPMVLREGWVPDLTDPATLGCLLALVRGAWGDPLLVAIYCEPAHPKQSEGWAVQAADNRMPVAGEDYETEAAALVAALEAAP